MLQRDKIRAFVSGLTGMLFLISVSVILTLSCRSLYKADMKHLHLAEETGYPEEEILANYDELIDYNLSPFHRELKFPTFPMSEEAKIHFEEVKVIFQGFLYLMLISGVLLAGIVIWMNKKKDWLFLKYAGISSIAIPIFLGALIALNWEKVFVTFHELIFRNDYWLFDPATDPVILVLPDAYFMHCAVMILAIVLAGAGGFLGTYHILSIRQQRKQTRIE